MRGFLLASIVLLGGCEHSIVKVIKKQEDKGVFGKPQYVIVPFASRDYLGFQPAEPITSEVEKSRLLTTQPVRCFFVVPSSAPSLDELKGKYTNRSSISAEVGATVATAGFDASHEEKGSWRFSKLRVVQGLGVPDTNGPCDFEEDKTVSVIGKEIVAGGVQLSFERKLEAKVDATAPVNPDLKVTVGGGHAGDVGTEISGKDLTLTGLLTDVKVKVKTETKDLGDTPPVGVTHDFPEGFDGDVTIVNFSASTQRLTVRPSSTLQQNAVAPKEFKPCALGSEHQLAAGERCDVWFSGGTSLVSIRWSYSDDGKKRVLLKLKGYRTSYAP